MVTDELIMQGVTLQWTTVAAFHSGEGEIFLVASCYRDRDKLQPDGPLGSYADVYMYFST